MENTNIHQLYQELELQFKVLESVDISKIQRNRVTRENILLGTLFIFGWLFLILIPLLLSSWGFSEGTSFLGGMLILLIVTTGPLFLYDKVGDYKLRQYKTIQDYHSNLFHSILILDDIDSILKRTQEVQELLKLTKKVTKDREAEIGELMKKEIHFILTILQYLKSDMFQAILREKDNLKNAQDTIQKNVGGTSEHNAISSIQQARLDKQIGQFEELQRVLVKV